MLVLGLSGVVGACALAARGLEPFSTWLYPFAWYPLLLALEGVVALRTGRFLVLDRPGALISLLVWSVPLWMVFELLNLRIRNWYYVLVPDRRFLAWLGITVSFATVLPACFLPAALTGLAGGKGKEGPGGHGIAPAGWPDLIWGGTLDEDRGGTPDEDPPTPSGRAPRSLRIAGVLCLVLPLVWPRTFFPLVWGALFLLAEPDLMRRRPSASLLVDLRRGRGGRVLALLTGGALAGFFWESLNWLARARWIYTVPGLEQVKLFEMPPLGFLGFPALALSGHAVYQWLVLQGVARPVALGSRLTLDGPQAMAPTRGGRGVALLAPLVILGALLGMERWSISSRSVHLRDLPGLLPSRVEDLRAWGVHSPFQLVEYEPDALAEAVPGVSPREARQWIEAARLATTRGLGARNARLLYAWGVESPEELARAPTGALVKCFEGVGNPPVRGAKIRIWQRAARRVAGEGGAEARAGGPGPTC